MATLNSFLSGLTVDDNVKDYKHGSKLFVDSNYRLMPKQTFLFFVVFSLNSVNNLTPERGPQHRVEIGQLVKSCDLPTFRIDTETKNQYNRQRQIHKKISYEPVQISFHDDSADVIRKFWYDYYSYYNLDGSHTEQLYHQQDKYAKLSDANAAWGMSGKARLPFINDVRIFSLHQKQATEYVLINPIISQCNFGNHNYEDGSGLMDINMTLEYEAIKLYENVVPNVPGFNSFHYDRSPSPLSPGGGSTDSIIGPGGLLDTTQSVAKDFAEGNLLGAILKTSVGLNNFRDVDFKAVARGEVQGVLNDVINGRNPTARFQFPTAASALSTIATVPSNITNNIATGISNAVSTVAVSNGQAITSSDTTVEKPIIRRASSTRTSVDTFGSFGSANSDIFNT